MAAWWCENLGFRVTLRRKSGSMFLADAAGNLAFEVYPTPAGKTPVDYRKMPYLQLHFGLRSDDVDGDTKRLLAAGAIYEAKDDAPGLHGVMFRDPQGIPFQIMSRAKSILR